MSSSRLAASSASSTSPSGRRDPLHCLERSRRRRLETILAVAGLALFWGLVFGIIDALVVRQLHYATSWFAILQAAASGLLTAAACLPVGLTAWGTVSLASRRLPETRRRTLVLTTAQAAAIFVPLTLGALAWLHQSLPEDTPVASRAGLALSAGILLLVLALSLGLSRLVASAPSAFNGLAATGYGLAVTALLIVGFGMAQPALPSSGRPNLLIITIDSLRGDTFFDHVEKHASPVLQRFVKAGRRYRNAHTTFTHSLAAHASMFTGLYPHDHGAKTFREKGGSLIGSPLRREVHPLAEVLGKSGYETFAVLTNPWLGSSFGLDRGFQTHVNDATPRALGSFNPLIAGMSSVFGPYLRYANRRFPSDKHTNTEFFLRWLRSRDRSRPFFAFLHYLDMHPPNVVETPYVERFCQGPLSKLDGRQIQAALWRDAFSEGELPAVHAQVRCLYEAAMARMDDYLSPVLAELMDGGWVDNTLVILVSDHGENLYEKVDVYEKEHVYETSSRIPLVLRVPGESEGSERNDLVSLVDIAATLYAYSEVRPGSIMSGTDLLSMPPRDGDAFDWIYVAGTDGSNDGYARAVLFADGHKYIRGAAGREELYDLRSDPRELVDLSGAQGALSVYRNRFDQIVAGTEGGRDRAMSLENLPQETLERLRALGYVQ